MKPGITYLLGCRELPGYVKIGHTRNATTLVSRLHTLASGCPFEHIVLRVWAQEPVEDYRWSFCPDPFAGEGLERALHAAFHEQRIKSEWFEVGQHRIQDRAREIIAAVERAI